MNSIQSFDCAGDFDLMLVGSCINQFNLTLHFKWTRCLKQRPTFDSIRPMPLIAHRWLQLTKGWNNHLVDANWIPFTFLLASSGSCWTRLAHLVICNASRVGALRLHCTWKNRWVNRRRKGNKRCMFFSSAGPYAHVIYSFWLSAAAIDQLLRQLPTLMSHEVNTCFTHKQFGAQYQLSIFKEQSNRVGTTTKINYETISNRNFYFHF